MATSYDDMYFKQRDFYKYANLAQPKGNSPINVKLNANI